MKLIFAGTPEFAAGYLEALIASDHEIVAVISQPDKPGKRGKTLIPSAVKVVAKSAGLDILQPDKLRLDDLNGIECDLMIVVAYGQILKQDVLDFPIGGCINVHASLLPRWRGAAPVQRAILAGDTYTGVTLIQMDAGLDTGDMLAKAEVPIDTHDSAGDVFEKLGSAGHHLLIETINNLASDQIVSETQNDEEAVYASKINKQEALVNWQAGAETVDRTVRAFNPDPIAYTWLGEKRVRIHEGEIQPDTQGRAGMILDVTKKGILVGCGDSAY
ncbi:MAG: methionyl-tRNA formyltransferase, partial [Pseudomonadales bacterium]|nr:methionyl-tRNA formyltransferase [Pseudomonadales bacterium]